MVRAKTAGSVDGIDSSSNSVGSNSDYMQRRRKWWKASSNYRSLLWSSQNKQEFGHSFKRCNSHLSMYIRKQNQHRCLTSCLIRSLVSHLDTMILQLHEYLMRRLSDIHTSPHQRKRIMVQYYFMHAYICTCMHVYPIHTNLKLRAVHSVAKLKWWRT